MHSTHRNHAKICKCKNCYHTKRGSHNFINNGSRIDKLYYENYLPLREKKLLDKLIRTRAVYDDIRDKILSQSSTDIQEKERKTIRKINDDSNTIEDLVNLVDRGAPFNSSVNLDSDCCSCCSCSIVSDSTEHSKFHKHISSADTVNEYLTQKNRKEKKGVHYRSVLSDPCVCRSKFKVTETRRPKHKYEQKLAVENMHKSNYKEHQPDLYQKQITTKPKALKHKCVCIIYDKKTKTESLSKVNSVTNRVRDSIRSSVTAIENVFHIKKDSIALFREKLNKKAALKAWACDLDYCIPDKCVPHECYEKIKTRQQSKSSPRKEQPEKKLQSLAPESQSTITSSSILPIKEVSRRTPKLMKHKPKPIKSKLCECKYKTISTASLTNISGVNKTRPSILKKKSTNQNEKYHDNFSVTPLPGSQESKHSLCDSRKCARIYLKSSEAAHRLDHCFCTLQLKQKKQAFSNRKKSIIPRSFAPKSLIKPFSKTSLSKKSVKRINIGCVCELQGTSQIQSSKVRSSTNNTKESATPPVSIAINPKQHKHITPYENQQFCVPGACDPFLCKERIKTRNLFNEESFSKHIISSARSRKPKMTSVSVTKSPPKNFQARFPKHRKPSLKAKAEVPYAAKSKSSPNAPTRQAIAIGSSFRFDIEFFKNFPEQTENTKTNQNIIYSKSPSVKAKRSISDSKLDYGDSHKISRQKSRSTYYDESILEPFLKKCRCSFKPYRPKLSNRSTSKVTMTPNVLNRYIFPKKSRSSVPYDTAVVNYVIPPPNYRNKLMPYECEPNFCTPGECDPNVCLDRIKKRNMTSKNTCTTCSPRHSVSSSTSTITSKSAATYPRTVKKRYKNRGFSSSSRVSKPRPLMDKSKSSPTTLRGSKRQAVKIGSTFKFDIEFFRNKNYIENIGSSTIKERKDTPRVRGRSTDTRKYIARLRTRRVGNNRPHFNERMSQISKNVRSRFTATEPFLKKCFCTFKLQKNLQVKERKVMTCDLDNCENEVCENRAISTQTKYVRPPRIPNTLSPYECESNFCDSGQNDPLVCEERIKKRNRESGGFLKRCFCTLKFHSPINYISKGTKIDPIILLHSRSIGTDTLKIKHKKYGPNKLLPYECEPGICTPGACNPYECLKHINKRNFCDATHQTKYAYVKPRGRSVCTSKLNIRSQESQAAFIDQCDVGQSYCNMKKERNVSVSPLPSKAPKKQKNIQHIASPSLNNNSRQSVKFGSQISFNIEFFKDITAPQTNYVTPTYKDNNRTRRKSNYTQGFKISRNKGVYFGKEYRNRDSQAGLFDKANKSSFTDSKLERCFCTLKLQKKGHQRQHYEQQYHAQQVFLDNTSPFLQDSRIICARECKATHCFR